MTRKEFAAPFLALLEIRDFTVSQQQQEWWYLCVQDLPSAVWDECSPNWQDWLAVQERIATGG